MFFAETTSREEAGEATRHCFGLCTCVDLIKSSLCCLAKTGGGAGRVPG